MGLCMLNMLFHFFCKNSFCKTLLKAATQSDVCDIFAMCYKKMHETYVYPSMHAKLDNFLK